MTGRPAREKRESGRSADPHHTGLAPTLLLGAAVQHTKYPLSKDLCKKQSRQVVFYTPTPPSLLFLETPPTPFFEVDPFLNIFFFYLLRQVWILLCNSAFWVFVGLLYLLSLSGG